MRPILGINDGRRPRVQALLSIKTLDVRSLIWFLLDTGSTSSAISESAASLAGIDVASLPYDKREGWGFGGGFKYKVINRPSDLVFRAVGNEYHTVPQSGFKVIPAEHQDPDIRKKMLELTPSILGMDILSGFEIHVEKKTVRLVPYGE